MQYVEIDLKIKDHDEQKGHNELSNGFVAIDD